MSSNRCNAIRIEIKKESLRSILYFKHLLNNRVTILVLVLILLLFFHLSKPLTITLLWSPYVSPYWTLLLLSLNVFFKAWEPSSRLILTKLSANYIISHQDVDMGGQGLKFGWSLKKRKILKLSSSLLTYPFPSSNFLIWKLTNFALIYFVIYKLVSWHVLRVLLHIFSSKENFFCVNFLQGLFFSKNNFFFAV